jgi:DNA-damage-inducible protein J
MMASDTTVRARIDSETKAKAASVLEAMGLSVSDAVRLMITRVATDGALPFDLFVPNTETIEAMEAARRDDVVKVGYARNLIARLSSARESRVQQEPIDF